MSTKQFIDSLEQIQPSNIDSLIENINKAEQLKNNLK